MWEYLTFNKFIAQDVLIFFYYFGVVIMPLILWFMRSYFIKKFLVIEDVENTIVFYFNKLSFENKLKLFLGFFITFICMQLCWRMIFEVMIGYFDMHNYLYSISKELLK